MMPITQEEIAKLEAEHKRIAHVRSPDGEWEIVLRKPKRAEYKHLRAASHNPTQAPDALEQLVRKLAIFPTGDAVDALLEEWPGIPEACYRAVEKLAGIAGVEDRKY